MGDMREAGRKADAHRVRGLVRDRYSNPTKDRIRSWIVAEIAAAGPTLVLDLWGGGRSAEEMTAAGLSVLSVDRADGFREHGVSAARGERALRICAEEGGYRAGWGSAVRFAPECDAAWLDFMGHLCGETERVLRSCRGMKILAITLMPDRMAGVANLRLATWVAMYRAAIEFHAGLLVSVIRKYQRHNGQWVLVMVARATLNKASRRMISGIPSEHQLERNRQLKRARRLAVKADPQERARQAALRRKWREKNKERLAALRKTNVEARARELERVKERYRTDPIYRERKKARERERAREKYASDPTYRTRLLAVAKRRYRTDAVFREHKKMLVAARNRRVHEQLVAERQERRAASQATTCVLCEEAISATIRADARYCSVRCRSSAARRRYAEKRAHASSSRIAAVSAS